MDRHELTPDGEQHPLSALRDLIGDYRTLAFWAWADDHGKRHGRNWRRQVFIPQNPKTSSLESLVAAIGYEATLQVCQYFGGAILDLPNGRWVMRRRAQHFAQVLHGQGLAPKAIADEVTESGYKVSPYQVREWLREGRGIDDSES